ncbi:hypothetical protein BD324DRAFT_448824 [Kockovaella imperatae]|uniref:N-acetyltransferase domain-containing protein n=1 Tax=Kockovaella imperatae TaxID=4999 RepID=A0A1Y1UIV1_9TREE|nr:hypothetical protein BD324DRAFT_448824 [Kockovaella imperatae]ORX37416.1 hypothetical protein BD324DRAFT_448824 [Kockovaella imperatae]
MRLDEEHEHEILSRRHEEARTELAEGHGALNWVLVQRSDPEGQIYAGCDTYRIEALIKRKSKESIEDTFCYGITSVYTPVQHRKGYGRHLLRVLHYILARPRLPAFPLEWGDPPALAPKQRELVPWASFSFVCSDIGSEYYSKCTIGDSSEGFAVNPLEQNELHWKILPPEDEEGSFCRHGPGDDHREDDWLVLYDKDLPRIKSILREGQKRNLENRDTVDHSVFALDPEAGGVCDFVAQGGETGVREPWPILDKVEPRGVQRGDTVVMFARYDYQVPKDTLIISFVQKLTSDDLPSLLRVLDRLGTEVGLRNGWIWGLDPTSELVRSWEALPGRNTKVGLRQGNDAHLYGIARYEDQGGILVDQQMWIWL